MRSQATHALVDATPIALTDDSAIVSAPGDASLPTTGSQIRDTMCKHLLKKFKTTGGRSAGTTLLQDSTLVPRWPPSPPLPAPLLSSLARECSYHPTAAPQHTPMSELVRLAVGAEAAIDKVASDSAEYKRLVK